MNEEIKEPMEKGFTRVIFDHKGWQCQIVKTPVGIFCGYVSIPESHPCFEKHYGGLDLSSIDVHGGLTFSKNGLHGVEGWWVGFDRAHTWDLVPGMIDYPGSTYKDFPYVLSEVQNLVSQLSALVV